MKTTIELTFENFYYRTLSTLKKFLKIQKVRSIVVFNRTFSRIEFLLSVESNFNHRTLNTLNEFVFSQHTSLLTVRYEIKTEFS